MSFSVAWPGFGLGCWTAARLASADVSADRVGAMRDRRAPLIAARRICLRRAGHAPCPAKTSGLLARSWVASDLGMRVSRPDRRSAAVTCLIHAEACCL